jgi:hypothetical protein
MITNFEFNDKQLRSWLMITDVLTMKIKNCRMDYAWILIIIALVLAAYVWGTWTYKHFENLNIPCEKPLPFLGNMWPVLAKTKSLGDLIEDSYKKFKGSGIIGSFQFRTPVIVVYDPELIKLITVKDFDHFTDHFSVLTEEDDPLFGKFLFALKGTNKFFYLLFRHLLKLFV